MTSQGNTSKALSNISKRPNSRSRSKELNHMRICHPLRSQRIFGNNFQELGKNVNMLMKVVEEMNYEIASLKNHIESHDAAESSHIHSVKNTDKGKAVMQESQAQNLTSIASMSIHQLQETIANSIKIQYDGSTQTFSLYFKPYTKRIDNLRMSNGYQPPKFQQFNEKCNPKQHVAHFIETCEIASTRGDLLVKQFIQTLIGNTFDWYTDLEPKSIDI
ncbi:ty3-gypsy retrotransposon protein [Cucumis melo var. makuwa]|uniref:Ty3-gypsy retrotransposon protein n=1 Tax=Cucumis melo var. makuwa TaxID=1194695 RepID=A0A5A7T046_CUCMM|nr:ty3-gypsy retrotransposon protein [Cucumis melo var. makuwa]TYJ96687.1 ty3-gypsy retrotransposon protein [Cucumis melo var. makuwa]